MAEDADREREQEPVIPKPIFEMDTSLPFISNRYVRSIQNPESFSSPVELLKLLSPEEKVGLFKLAAVKSEVSRILKDQNSEDTNQPFKNLSLGLPSDMPFLLVEGSHFQTHVSRQVVTTEYSPVTLLETMRILRQNGISVDDFLEMFPAEWSHLANNESYLKKIQKTKVMWPI